MVYWTQVILKNKIHNHKVMDLESKVQSKINNKYRLEINQKSLNPIYEPLSGKIIVKNKEIIENNVLLLDEDGNTEEFYINPSMEMSQPTPFN